MKVKLGELTSIKTGKLDANAASEDGEYPFFTCSKDTLKISTYTYDCECVLVAGNGDLNVKYYKGKFDAYQRTYIIENNSNNKLFMLYLYFFLENYVEELREQAIGGVIKYIKLGNLANAEIELPPLKEQIKIVTILKKVKEIISEKNRQILELNDLNKARFVEIFGDILHNSKGWQIRTFSEITTSRLGKMLDAKQQTGKNSFPYLANFNVQWFRFETENLNKMDFSEGDRAEFELLDGDLLICEGGEIGRCAVWHNEVQPCYFQKALHRVRCKKDIIIPEYLAWWFKYNCDHKGFAAIEGARATISHLTGAKLKTLPVAVPPLELQQQFAAFVTQTDKSKAMIQKSIDENQILFDSLMQKYFG
ncbi:restriction endonuclease subunit S [Hungatella hathewayi]|uniref:restriction endonuclease subunit S n=1 Tax=Hungatella hathewayi TaxID=154046 RepID=UPI003565020C